jgi:hypothetical protein
VHNLATMPERVQDELRAVAIAYWRKHRLATFVWMADRIDLPAQTFHDKVTGKQPFTLPEAERLARLLGWSLELRPAPGETP